MPEPVDRRHLLLIGAGPGVGAGVVRRFGREGFRSTLISHAATLEQLAPELRSFGIEIEAVGANIDDLDSYRATLEQIFASSGAPGVVVYNAAFPDPGQILDTTVERLRIAYAVHAATITITGVVKPGTAFDPDKIAELFWTAHTAASDAWQTEYRFTGA
jgi:NAD(P)-dependent dehydrogenase (short-subunit alcohol dehydrogenase family)